MSRSTVVEGVVRGLEPLLDRQAQHPELPGDSRAAQAVAALSKELSAYALDEAGTAAFFARSSEQVKADWVRDGLVVGSAELGATWGRTRQALEQACDRGELFNLKMRNRRYYCSGFLDMNAADVRAVCKLMQGIDPIAQFLFWEGKHGAFGGLTLFEAVAAGKLPEVLWAAESYASEHAEHAPA